MSESETMNERLKEVRKKQGLSQTDFALRLGVQKSAISKIETNANNLTEQMILAICREYGVSEEWFRHGSGQMEAEKVIDEKESAIKELSRLYHLDDITQIWLKVFLSLDDKGKKELKAAALQISEFVAKVPHW